MATNTYESFSPDMMAQLYAPDMPVEQATEPEYEPEIDASEQGYHVLDAINHPNVAELLSKEKLAEIGSRVVDEYEIDKASRAEWEKANEEAMKIAKQVHEDKSDPWPGCANIRYPLITTASIQFAARAYPEIVRSNDSVVKAKVLGEDPYGSKAERADRVSKHMSWQLTEEMKEWEEDTDKLLHMLPVMGIAFRKTYFDPALGRNVSELVSAENCIVNSKVKSLDTARRITHYLDDIYQNDIKENVASGIWLDEDFGLSNVDSTDEDAPHIFLEQHRYLDLDDDGYAEPYVVTVHLDTCKVVRIVARFNHAAPFPSKPESGCILVDEEKDKIVKIQPIQYFTKYGFIPSPDGSFYDLGFGQLLGDLNESVNSVINQLLDAGAMSNTGGGFLARGIRLKKTGALSFSPNEWKYVDVEGGVLRDGIVPLPVREPSSVLFQLLGTLIDAATNISSVKDILVGGDPGANTPATSVLAQIEQGQKVMSSIYKRVFRSLGEEFKKIYALNGQYLEPEQYFTFLDLPQQIQLDDYNAEDLDITPCADPNMSSDMQRLAKAQAIMQISGRPGINEQEVTRMYVDAVRPGGNYEILIPQEELQAQQEQQGPPPEVQLKMQELQLKQAEIEMKAQQSQADIQMQQEKLEAEVEKIRSESALNIATIIEKQLGPYLQRIQMVVDALDADHERQHNIEMEQMRQTYAAEQADADRQAANAGMDGASGNSGTNGGTQETTGNVA